jgi:hypothetical protein
MVENDNPRTAEAQLAELIQLLLREARKGLIEGVITVCLSLSLLGWSLATRAGDSVGIAQATTMWCSIPVGVAALGYFARAFDDYRTRARLTTIRGTLAAERGGTCTPFISLKRTGN